MKTYELPKKEEHPKPETSPLINSNNEFSGGNLQSCPSEDTDITEDLEGILGITDDDGKFSGGDLCPHGFTWDFWAEEDEEEETRVNNKDSNLGFRESGSVKDYEEKQICLNLNLNYQEVIDAWSERQSPLWTDTSSSAPSNGFYVSPTIFVYHHLPNTINKAGEVPVMEEETYTKREASVLRYKEKRQNRLFSKKIRYQVRKLNAEKRPRLKGRFVKRE